jgi:N-acetylglutamate synthase-like GNAT family acetyltransferase
MSETDSQATSLTARPADGAALARLLASNDLPTEDLAAPGRRFFEFTDSEGDPVGVGGLELYGEAALLRSVVTLKVARGGGYGRAIVEWLAAHAAKAGARELYLLTFSAPGFFAACGFHECSRADVPAAIAATEEFANLCPASAVCLMRELGASGTA